MTANDGNIYRTARKMAGMTQERWAEAIGVDVRSIQRYEQGETVPDDAIVSAMAMISAHPVLCYWHMTQRSQLGDVLPEVQHIPLAQAVVGLICAISDFNEDEKDLLRVVSDGKIDAHEVMTWEQIRGKLDEVVRCALQVKYAEEVE